MSKTPTVDQVTEAAQNLDSDVFTRAQLADELGVKPMDLQEPVKEARDSGKLEKTGNNEHGKGLFKLA